MHPQAFLLDNTRTVVALMQRDYRAAVAAGREVSEMNPGYAAAYKPYLAALGHLDEVQEAGIVRQRDWLPLLGAPRRALRKARA